ASSAARSSGGRMRALPAATRDMFCQLVTPPPPPPGAGTHRLSLLDAAPLASRRRGGAPQQTPPSSFELAGERGQRNLDLAGPLVWIFRRSCPAGETRSRSSNVRGAQQGASDEHKDPPRPQEPSPFCVNPFWKGLPFEVCRSSQSGRVAVSPSHAALSLAFLKWQCALRGLSSALRHCSRGAVRLPRLS